MKRRRFSWLLMLPLLASVAEAATLDQLIAEARKHDSQYRAALASYRAAEGRADQAFAKLLPVFNATANASRNSQSIEYVDRAIPQQDSRFSSYGYNFQVVQPLYRPVAGTENRQAKAQLRQARYQVMQAELELAKRVSENFFDVCQARDTVAAAEAQVVAAEAKEEAVRLQLTHGTATEAEQLDASFKVNLGRSEVLDARAELESKLFALKQMTGRELSADELQYSDIPLPSPPLPTQRWLDRALQCSPIILAQKEARDAAKLELQKAAAGHHPTLDLVGNHGSNKQGPTASVSVSTVVQSSSLGVQLAVPLYAGGGINAREREALAMLDKAEEDLSTAQRQVALDVQQANAGLRAGLGQVEAVRSAVAASSEALRATRLGEEHETRSHAEVLAVEQQLALARREFTKAHSRAILNEIRLRIAAGDFAASAGQPCVVAQDIGGS